jgi:hypothetical protein
MKGMAEMMNFSGTQRGMTVSGWRRRRKRMAASAGYIDLDEAARPPAPACDVSR